MLCQVHDDAAHKVVERTYSIESMVYWVGIATYAEKYVACCENCQKVKLLRPVKEMFDFKIAYRMNNEIVSSRRPGGTHEY